MRNRLNGEITQLKWDLAQSKIEVQDEKTKNSGLNTLLAEANAA
jgi:hypothetical protein